MQGLVERIPMQEIGKTFLQEMNGRSTHLVDLVALHMLHN